MVYQNLLRTQEEKQVVSENNFKFATVIYKKRLTQIKLPNYSTRAHLFLSYHLIEIPSITGPDTGVFPCFMWPKI